MRFYTHFYAVLSVYMLMRMVGVEPTRCYHRQILSLLRLPFRHIRTTLIFYHKVTHYTTGFYLKICLLYQKYISISFVPHHWAIPNRYIPCAPDMWLLTSGQNSGWSLSSHHRYWMQPFRRQDRSRYDHKSGQALRHLN